MQRQSFNDFSLWFPGLSDRYGKLCIKGFGFLIEFTAQKMKFSIKDFFSKFDQIRSLVLFWSKLLKKSLMKNFIFCSNLSTADIYLFKGNKRRIKAMCKICSKLIMKTSYQLQLTFHCWIWRIRASWEVFNPVTQLILVYQVQEQFRTHSVILPTLAILPKN